MKQEIIIGIDFYIDYTIHFYFPNLKIWISDNNDFKTNIIFSKNKTVELSVWNRDNEKIGFREKKHILKKYK